MLHQFQTSIHQLKISVLKSFFKDNWIHFLVWTLFVFYETIISGFMIGVFGKPGNYIVHYTANITLFYVHALFVIPKAAANPRHVYWKMPLYYILEVLAFMLILLVVDSLLIRYTTFIEFTLNYVFFLKLAYRALLFTGLGTGYYYLRKFLKEQEISKDLEKQRLTAIIAHQETQNELNMTVNAYLKAQINPHFLFNTLNFIYNNARKTAPLAAEAIMTLSEMMRYAIKSEDLDEYIYLHSELEQVENLIKLHQLRQNHTLHIKFDHSGCTHEVKFLPLVVMTLVENIFKHGNLSKASRPAEIFVSTVGGRLEISTSNLINEHHGKGIRGIGLDNTASRLKHTYGDRASFNYGISDDHIFTVSLVLDKAYTNNP